MPTVSVGQPDKPARLAYVRTSVDGNIWRVDMPAAGSPANSVPRVAISTTRIEGQSQFSPDGQRVTFTSTRSGTWQIWVSDPDGAHSIQLTSLDGELTAVPRWSPDGQLITFASDAEGQIEIYVVPATGGRSRRLTNNPAVDHVPSFSRDGKWIYFQSNRSGQFQIWKVPLVGGDAVQVTQEGGAVALESPDGGHLYYIPSWVNAGSTALLRLAASGGKPVKVLDDVYSGLFAVIDRGIYYLQGKPGNLQLHFYDFASGRSALVLRNFGDAFPVGRLTASPDGRTVLYDRLDSAIHDLMLVENFR
jgi:Tol biopolymer transport system component